MQTLICIISLLIITNIFFIVLYYKKKHLLSSGKILDRIDKTKFQQAELELKTYRCKLEQLVEEKTRKLEQAYLELQVLNKKLDTSNEELQAANEELNTTNEDLELSNAALSKEIGEHKKTQAEKAIIEEKLNQFISQSSEAIGIINDKGIVEIWNDMMTQISGITKENALGEFIWDLTYKMANDPENAESIRNDLKYKTLLFFEEVKQGNKKEQVSESQIKHPDLTYRYIHTTLFPIITGSGYYGGFIISDITRKKADEFQLKKYRDELEKLLEQKTEHLKQLSDRFNEVYTNTSEAITFLDILDDGNSIKVFDMNPVSKELFKITDKQLDKGVFIEELLPDIKTDLFKQNFLHKLLSGISVTFFNDTDTGNGYWKSTIYPIKDETGKVNCLAAFSRNVTAEHEREKTAVILQSAIDSWPFEFWARDNEGRQILQNKISKEKVGDLLGKRLEDFDIPISIKNQAKSLMQKVLSGESISFDSETSVSGQKRYVVYKLNPIISNNKINGYTGLVIDVTQQKLAEIALRESEKHLNLLLSSVTDYKFTIEVDNGEIVNSSHSEGCLAVTGYSTADLKNNPHLWIALTYDDDKPLIKEWSEKINKGIEVEPIEHRIIRKNGELIWVRNTTVLKKDNQGKLIGFDGLVSDITKRKNAELALRKSEEKYRLLAENINDIIWKFDINTLRYTYFSPSILKLTGYTVQEALQLHFEEILMPDSQKDLLTILPKWIEQFTNGVPDSKNRTFEYQIRQKNGFPVWVEINATIVTDSLGAIKEVVATSRSIEERKASELSLRISEERYHRVTELSGYMVYDYDLINQHIVWAGAVQQVTGYTNEEVGEKNLEELLNLIHPEDRQKIAKSYVTEKNSIYNSSIQYRYLTKNKGYIWVETQAFLFTDDQNKQYRWLGIMRDISEQLRIQSLIKESEEKLKTIFNTTKDGIVLLNKNMEVFDVNNSALKRIGYSREEIVGKNAAGFLIKEEHSLLAQHLLSVWNKDVINNFETEIIIKDDGSFPVEISATALQIDKQEMLLLVIRDISERKQLEKKLLHSVINTEEKERIHFSQELHDGLGPLLSAAKMYTEWLAESEPGTDQKLIIQDIKKLLIESTQTVKDISFKLSPHILQNYGIVEALNAYAEKVKQSSKAHIAINAVNIGRTDEIIETIVYRVICECINNALKYAKADNIIVSLKLTDHILNIDLSDDGIGFDISTVSEKHKGIGLLNIQSRLKSINGQFSIQSTPDSGTKVSIKIPLHI